MILINRSSELEFSTAKNLRRFKLWWCPLSCPALTSRTRPPTASTSSHQVIYIRCQYRLFMLSNAKDNWRLGWNVSFSSIFHKNTENFRTVWSLAVLFWEFIALYDSMWIILATKKLLTLEDLSLTSSKPITLIILFAAKTMNMLYNKIENNMGVGVSAAILTGEVREAKQSTFNPLEKVPVSVLKWRHTVIIVRTFVTLWIWCIINRFWVKKRVSTPTCIFEPISFNNTFI